MIVRIDFIITGVKIFASHASTYLIQNDTTPNKAPNQDDDSEPEFQELEMHEQPLAESQLTPSKLTGEVSSEEP